MDAPGRNRDIHPRCIGSRNVFDRKVAREHDLEASFLLGRFMTEHLIRVYKAFDGDITAAIVLGTIGQYNYQRYYAEVGAKSPEGFQQLVAKGEHIAHQRTCNAMSISDSTGTPSNSFTRRPRKSSNWPGIAAGDRSVPEHSRPRWDRLDAQPRPITKVH